MQPEMRWLQSLQKENMDSNWSAAYGKGIETNTTLIKLFIWQADNTG